MSHDIDVDRSWFLYVAGEHALDKSKEAHDEEGDDLLAEKLATEGVPHLGPAALQFRSG